MTTAQDRRLRKIETATNHEFKLFVLQIHKEGETVEEAWAAKYGDLPRPPESQLIVITRRFISPGGEVTWGDEDLHI